MSKTIKELLYAIRNATFGKEVRGALADGLEAVSNETTDTTKRQEHLEETFDQLIINAGTSNAEVVDARVDKNTGQTYKKIGDRLDDHSERMESNVQDLQSEKMYSNIFLNRLNPDAPLDIKTYDGGNEAMHPKVLFFPNYWNGYKFWMTYTPYKGFNEAIENPCIAVSNDGINWSTPVGLTNPIDDIQDVSIEHLSDPHLVYRADLNRIECWYRHSLRPNNLCEKIYRKHSTDGIHWSEKELLFTSVGTEVGVVSPAVIYEDGKYKIWASYATLNDRYNRCLKYYESQSGNNWQFVRNINLDTETHYISHLDVIRVNNKYEAVVQMINKSTQVLEYIYHYTSSDNITYGEPRFLLGLGKYGKWDAGRMYRPSLTFVNGVFWMYYCATSAPINGKWATGLIKLNDSFENRVRNISEQYVQVPTVSNITPISPFVGLANNQNKIINFNRNTSLNFAIAKSGASNDIPLTSSTDTLIFTMPNVNFAPSLTINCVAIATIQDGSSQPCIIRVDDKGNVYARSMSSMLDCRYIRGCISWISAY